MYEGKHNAFDRVSSPKNVSIPMNVKNQKNILQFYERELMFLMRYIIIIIIIITIICYCINTENRTLRITKTNLPTEKIRLTNIFLHAAKYT